MRKDNQVTVQIPTRPPVDTMALLKRCNSYGREDMLHFLTLGEQNQDLHKPFKHT